MSETVKNRAVRTIAACYFFFSTNALRRATQKASVFLMLFVATIGKVQSPSVSFLIKMYEAETDLSARGVDVHNCAVVLPNGKLRLEVKKQQLPNPTTTFSVYEYSLTNRQLEDLLTIIGDERIINLPLLQQPQHGFSVPYFRGFEAMIPRGTQIQKIGYFALRPGEDMAIESPNSAPDDVKNQWRESEAGLAPLVAWFHDEITSQRLPMSKKRSQRCFPELK